MNLIGTKVLETKNLVLRKVTVKDAEEAYNNWCSNPKVSFYLPWDVHKNVEETKELIGTIDVVSSDLKSEVLEVGYCYSENKWGKGYGTEALKAVLKFLFLEVDCYLVYAKHNSNNIGSGKVMQKAGMHFEGSLRDRLVDDSGVRGNLVFYSITKEEYLKENKNV